MQNEKKLLLKRIVIFTVLAYIPTYLISIFWIKDVNKTTELQSLLIMFPPAIANILTRLITKEGTSEMLLRTNFKGNIRYYIFAVLFAVIGSIFAAILLIVNYIPDYSFADSVEFYGKTQIAGILMMNLSLCIITSVITFGEEFGWRAYLTPRLEKLTGTVPAIIISGIIWGMWHAPMIAKGFNYGKDYDFFPFGGFIAMSVSCIFYGAFLTWLTKKTNSVYPAVLCHSAVDIFINTIPALMIPDQSALAEHSSLIIGILFMLPNIIISAFAFAALIISDYRNKKKCNA